MSTTTVIQQPELPNSTVFPLLDIHEWFWCWEHGLCIKIGPTDCMEVLLKEKPPMAPEHKVWEVNVEVTYKIKPPRQDRIGL